MKNNKGYLLVDGLWSFLIVTTILSSLIYCFANLKNNQLQIDKELKRQREFYEISYQSKF